jgi:starvation-inducible DNA-binding protein
MVKFESLIDFKPNQRKLLAQPLGSVLVDLLDLNLSLKQAHWNVRGINFYSLHAFFDALASQVSELVDLVAERIVQLGFPAQGGVEDIMQGSHLAQFELGSADKMLNQLSQFYVGVLKTVRALIDELSFDPVTVDILTEVARSLEKQLWQLSVHTA